METQMKNLFAILFVLMCVFAVSANAQSVTAAQTVNLSVGAVTLMTISGPATLSITTGTAGDNVLTAVQSISTSYSITHNKSGGPTKKITAQFTDGGGNLPAGIVLKVTLASGKGVSSGQQILTTTPIEVVGTIARGADNGRLITYDFSATAEAGELASVAKTVTFTLTD
jgi:hypothetical protein